MHCRAAVDFPNLDDASGCRKPKISQAEITWIAHVYQKPLPSLQLSRKLRQTYKWHMRRCWGIDKGTRNLVCGL